jgi:periplasmic protein TonB
MRRGLTLSLLLHAALAATPLRLPVARPPRADEPARIEMLFGSNGTTATQASASAPTAITKDVPPAAAQAPAHRASADPGVVVDGPDPSLIPARVDPGNHAPDYPQAAWQRREQGTVVLRLFIAADGSVARLEKRASSGYAALDSAAAAALSGWHFQPARRHGQPVASYRDQPIRFLIQ